MTAIPEQLRYPIGKWNRPEHFDPSALPAQINILRNFSAKLAAAVAALDDKQLDTPYRPEGWTVRQVVHHCGDSHANALIRFKLALTEELPTIKPYLEDRWAELADGKSIPVQPSLLLLEGLHARWTVLLQSLEEPQWQRGFIHPEHGRELKLFQVLSLYAWHCDHHLAHIIELKKREGW